MSKRIPRPPQWVIKERQTNAYGMVICTVTRPDGERFEGTGFSRGSAYYRAMSQARPSR